MQEFSHYAELKWQPKFAALYSLAPRSQPLVKSVLSRKTLETRWTVYEVSRQLSINLLGSPPGTCCGYQRPCQVAAEWDHLEIWLSLRLLLLLSTYCLTLTGRGCSSAPVTFPQLNAALPWESCSQFSVTFISRKLLLASRMQLFILFSSIKDTRLDKC